MLLSDIALLQSTNGYHHYTIIRNSTIQKKLRSIIVKHVSEMPIFGHNKILYLFNWSSFNVCSKQKIFP